MQIQSFYPGSGVHARVSLILGSGVHVNSIGGAYLSPPLLLASWILFGFSASWRFGFSAFLAFCGLMCLLVASAFIGFMLLSVAFAGLSALTFGILCFPSSSPAGGFLAFMAFHWFMRLFHWFMRLFLAWIFCILCFAGPSPAGGFCALCSLSYLFFSFGFPHPQHHHFLSGKCFSCLADFYFSVFRLGRQNVVFVCIFFREMSGGCKEMKKMKGNDWTWGEMKVK